MYIDTPLAQPSTPKIKLNQKNITSSALVAYFAAKRQILDFIVFIFESLL